jgi:general secretion pathway protein D
MGNSGRPNLAFSSFGLSNVDPNTGTLTIKPGLGFNGAFLSADIADIVIRAVSNHSRAKVVSAPRILVNDNATGTLASVNEAPFTSINASNTVSTTSFAGYASAGTTITVTPHISEGNHLQIEYQVTLSSFTGQAQSNSPPPRQTNTVQSKVTVPDGGTIVVGGLNRMDQSSTVTGIPLLDQIPLVNLATSNRTDNKAMQSLFVFIRPIVMRDDEFEDLKYLSARDNLKTKIPEDEPSSEPLVIP